MKTLLSLLFALCILGGSATCFGAAAVFLNNHDVNGGSGNPVFFMNTGTLADARCYVEILAGLDEYTLQPIASSNPGLPMVFALNQGYFDGGIAILPFYFDAGVNTYFKVIAWKGTGNVDGWHNPLLRADASWTQITGTYNSPNDSNPAILQFPSLTLSVPEPPILALAILGSVLWLKSMR